MTAGIEGITELRPLSVRRDAKGHWYVVDLGGRLGMRVWLGWVTTPFRPVCCWPAAVGLADYVASVYRGGPEPGWLERNGGIAPGCCAARRGVAR